MLNERFWSKVFKDPHSECWKWQANKNNKGYGMFRPGGVAPKRLAHRLSYEDCFGAIPRGTLILHSCDNPSCVNPEHLRLGSHKDNVADMDIRGRRITTQLKGEQNPISKLTTDQVITIRGDYLSGNSIQQIAAKFELSELSIPDYVSGRSWTHILRPGELEALKKETQRRKKPNAKITPEIVREIRYRLSSGEQGKDIAASFDIHKATVSDIKLRKIWADVD